VEFQSPTRTALSPATFVASLIEQTQVYYRSRTNRSAIQFYPLRSTSRKHDISTVYIGSSLALSRSRLSSGFRSPWFPSCPATCYYRRPSSLRSMSTTPCPLNRLDVFHLASATPHISSCGHIHPQGIARHSARGALLCYFRRPEQHWIPAPLTDRHTPTRSRLHTLQHLDSRLVHVAIPKEYRLPSARETLLCHFC
jgi:hypothetical protein